MPVPSQPGFNCLRVCCHPPYYLPPVSPSQVFWPAEQHFLRPVVGHYTFANMHALGVPNVLSAWVRPEVRGRGKNECAMGVG